MSSDRPQAISKLAGQDSTPDTDPNSPFWQSAPCVWMVDDAQGNKVAGHATEVRSRWTVANLYFLFICPYEELHLKPAPVLTEKTHGLWNWDVAEAFIGSRRDPIHRYKEFELSPRGEWLDLDIDLKQPDKVAKTTWTSGFQVAARIQQDRKIWYGCMQIPYASIEEGEAFAGNVLYINFFRSQGPKPVELAWQPPLHSSFHVPEQFGTLRLS